jgi:hypothetical protein
VVTDGREIATRAIEIPETATRKIDIGETVTVNEIVTIERAVPKSGTDETGIEIEIEIANGTVEIAVIRIVLNLLRRSAARGHVQEGGDDIYIVNNQPPTPTQSTVYYYNSHRLAA